jgi:fumarylacetoacetase
MEKEIAGQSGGTAQSWVPGADGSGFGLGHLPYGSFSLGPSKAHRLGVRIGDFVCDLAASAQAGALGALPEHQLAALRTPDLNAFMALGKPAWQSVRAAVGQALGGERPPSAAVLVPLAEVRMGLPFTPADYIDGYASREHVERVGALLRPDEDPLPANWLHLPVGYHGRAGTLVVSGTEVVRPRGQSRPSQGSPPAFGPTAKLDIEVELGFINALDTPLGSSVPIAAVDDHIFGLVLLNDWSARDIQAFEYRPLGPFLGKSFATSIAAWVTPIEAVEHLRVDGPHQHPPVLDYLRRVRPWNFDLTIEVWLTPTGGQPQRISTTNPKRLYWDAAQQLAHATINGAALRTGDLHATGTISGAEPGTQGSLIELTRDGREPITLKDESIRAYLEDGDHVHFIATTRDRVGQPLTLAPVHGTVNPARRAV